MNCSYLKICAASHDNDHQLIHQQVIDNDDNCNVNRDKITQIQIKFSR